MELTFFYLPAMVVMDLKLSLEAGTTLSLSSEIIRRHLILAVVSYGRFVVD